MLEQSVKKSVSVESSENLKTALKQFTRNYRFYEIGDKVHYKCELSPQ